MGHQQRGGSPTAADRILASRMGAAAVDSLLKGHCDIMIGTEGEKLVEVPLDLVTKQEKKTQLDLISLANILAT
ncbi:6-phosphofructokinase isozyme 1 [compost metagenome]